LRPDARCVNFRIQWT